MLRQDSDTALIIELARDFSTDLESLSSVLLRIYQAESLLLPRIFSLAEREINENVTAAVLFRGNSILTKTVELYQRLVGVDYLEASIGETIRRICSEKLDFELDPAKMRAGAKEKDFLSNGQSLMTWSNILWNSIYAARQRCPSCVVPLSPLRSSFH